MNLAHCRLSYTGHALANAVLLAQVFDANGEVGHALLDLRHWLVRMRRVRHNPLIETIY